MTQEEKNTHRTNKLFTYATSASVALSAGVGLGANGVLNNISPDKLLGNSQYDFNFPSELHRAPTALGDTWTCKTPSTSLVPGENWSTNINGHPFQFINNVNSSWGYFKDAYVGVRRAAAGVNAQVFGQGVDIVGQPLGYFGYLSNFRGAGENYLGFTTGNNAWGWARIDVSGTGNLVKVIKVCWEMDADEPAIKAGYSPEPSAVEMVNLEASATPGTWSAIGATLLAGIAGVWAWLRRRKASAA